MRREVLLLREMLEAAGRISRIIGDLDAEAVRSDELRRDALLWNFTVLGEAAAMIPDDIRLAHPAVEWRQATRLRNRIVHGYWDVDFQILHDVASVDLPAMAEGLARALADLSRGTEAD